MNESFLEYICEAPKIGKKSASYWQCVCGQTVHAVNADVKSGRKISCGCKTKDGRKMNGQSKHPLYGTWTVNHQKEFPDFELFVAELGVPPFEGATVTAIQPDTKACPGNVTWGKPIFTHGNDRIDPELFMPLDPKLFGQYNIDAYKEEKDPSSWQHSLDQLTKQYDQLRSEYEDDPFKLQQELEKLSAEEAVNNFTKKEDKVTQSGRSNQSTVWQSFKDHLLPIIVERLEAVHKSAMMSRSGIHHNVVTPILSQGLISSDEIALIGLNVLLDALGDGTGFKTPLITVYKTIGARIDDQCYLRWWSDNFPSDFEYVNKWILSSNGGYHKRIRKAVAWFENKIPEGIAESYKRVSRLEDAKGKRLGDEPLVHLGEWVHQAIQSCTLWFTAEKLWHPDKDRAHQMYYLGLSAEGMRWRSLIDQGIKELLFEAQPMVIEPKPWPEEHHKHNHGGYITPKPLNFSKLIHNCKGTKPSPEAIRALNKVQSVGYKINDFMFHTIASLLGTNTKIGNKFVCHERNEFLDQNWPDIDPAVWMLPKSSDEYRKAKALLARTYAKCISNEQLQNVPFRCLKTAAKFLNYERIYFPCYFDNRLRIYYLHTSGLSPQGANYAKSLLLFADPLPVTDDNREDVKRDLLISLANCWGNDKISNDDRVTFALELAAQHEYVAKEPLSSGAFAAWTGCSEPFTYLATLRQYHEIFTWKTRNTTDIPNGRDATSSGLQLMSSLLREEKAMKFTNVIPGDIPADLYAEVARYSKALLNNYGWMQDQLAQRLENAIKKSEKTGRELQKDHFEFDLDSEHVGRSTAKRPVMCDSYNASWRSKNEYVSTELVKLEQELGRKVTLAEKVIVTNAICTGQDQAFPICKEIKSFFRKIVTDVIGMQGRNVIRWTTPCGSEMQQRYNKKQCKQILTFAMGGAKVYKPKVKENAREEGGIYLTIQKETDETDKSHHTTSLSPNVHHSYDAYICQQAILRSGTDVVASTHDCFYWRAGEVQRGLEGARDAFHALVSSNVLQDLVEGNGCTSVVIPKYGDDALLDGIYDASYMFH